MIKKLFKNQYQNLVNEINDLENNFKTLTDNELRAISFKLQKNYQLEKNLNNLITEAFALTREASRRTLGLRHFDVQLLGGLVLNNQKIAEMKTGEGKSLVATLPSFLNAITKKGVHIITVNDYLANRDQVSMGQIYRFLGLDTGLVQDKMSISEKKENYNADITYLTSYDVTFDYLRDNMAINVDDIILRPFHYCIIDEVDSVLIDEAQTPLILSNTIPTLIQKYIIAAEIIKYLELNIHYKIDEKNRNVILTESGTEQIEKVLKFQDLYDRRNPWIPYLINALKANTLYLKNVHYIVQNNTIIIVDEFTGRLMPDRRWGDGLHQAIEAKERLPISQSSETTATITYQNFFLLYPKLSGMTGTGKTAEVEFEKIYNLSVTEIPTAKPNQRKDLSDLIYKDQFSKWNAIAQTCTTIASTGQPILIGTKTVEKSEMLAQLLNEYNLSYQILNAKPENVRKESEIVAQAGKQNSITIATNMAGRGTDIILGGNINFKTQKKLYEILSFIKNYKSSKTILQSSVLNAFAGSSQKFISVLLSLVENKDFLKLSDIDILRTLKENDQTAIPQTSYQYSIQFLINEFVSYTEKHHQQNNTIVKNLGGLYVIGTERNDSRRIDNQLRGRSGRQGDPGMSRFFLSLDDSLLRLFGSSKIQGFIRNQMVDNAPLEAEIISKSLDSAQTKIEERAYQIRKNLFDYDIIVNKQRKIVYGERKKILKNDSTRKLIFACAEQFLTEILVEFRKKEFNLIQLLLFFENLFGKKLLPKCFQDLNTSITDDNASVLQLYIFQEFWLVYFKKEREFSLYSQKVGDNLFTKLERVIMLASIDRSWREYLQELTLIKDAVGWRSYGQQNPLDEYNRDAASTFKRKLKLFRYLVIYELLRSSIL